MEYKHYIDKREIKCCCNSLQCRQGGISFEQSNSEEFYLHFHYLDIEFKEILSKRRSMILNEEKITELITALKLINKQIKTKKNDKSKTRI
jgi:hypothetical protein